MSHRKTRRVGTAAALVVLGAMAGAGAAGASDFTVDFPVGTACNFPLRVDGTGGNRIDRTFTDEAGNLVRILSTGTGFALTFTNLSTGKTLSLPSNGAVTRTTPLAGGLTRNVLTGHNVLFLYPSDVPAGPSTTLFTGRAVFTATPSSDYTLLETHGTSRDLCAELSD
ncbi:hypothetical protein FHX52_4041 [Humibacillus xanthopallidus]|uniref:Uncharacterized protein n=2 Tax=Humibacillus xanthopallidus TaxID=412689 RepID=A0A543PL74_9MICO|nr:hypothetical protein FHX52_4041 [Humibacillus xanthopallidus]